MKPVFAALLAVILEMVALCAPVKADSGRTYYGLIAKYPVTLRLTLHPDGTATGSYFYDKYHQELICEGNYAAEEIRLVVRDARGKTLETFIGLAEGTPFEKTREGNYPERIIGRWRQDQQNLPFELCTEPFAAETIAPWEDGWISVNEMKVFPELIFEDGVDLGSGGYSPVGVDYSHDIPLWRLFELGEKIRNDEDPRYSGSIMFATKRYYQFFFSKAMFAPEMVIDDNKGRYAEIIEENAGTWNYFKRWAVASIYNFEMYQAFVEEMPQTKKEIYRYYLEERQLSPEDAATITEIILAVILYRAAGAYPHYDGDYDLLSPLLAGLYNDADERELARYLAAEQDEARKREALRAALLLGKPLSVVKRIAGAIDELDGGAESPLACAVNSYEKTKLLIEMGADVNHENGFGKTALFYAIQYGNQAVVKLLVENGADVNHQYKRVADLEWEYMLIAHGRRTPLMHGAQHANVAVLAYLLEMGANLEDVDEMGDNALHYALRERKHENIAFLKNQGLKEHKD